MILTMTASAFPSFAMAASRRLRAIARLAPAPDFRGAATATIKRIKTT
jgi:hypothetical protein